MDESNKIDTTPWAVRPVLVAASDGHGLVFQYFEIAAARIEDYEKVVNVILSAERDE